MAGRPLRPATDRRLGRPLPHQLANPTSATPITRGRCQSPAFSLRTYAVLAHLSVRYPSVWGTFPRVTQPSAAPLEESHDLHVLGTPPAFILSQDQTLHVMRFAYETKPRFFLVAPCTEVNSDARAALFPFGLEQALRLRFV